MLAFDETLIPAPGTPVKKSLLLTSCALFACPGVASAQSTGTVDFENETIVVTGTRVREVGGVQAPDSSKARVVLTQEIIARQNPGQTILDTINLVPGVSFQNNDAYGSAGGTLTIRGFDSSRISLTVDGIQLNDSGNYAIYSNQQFDPELIEQVNVNLGSTDVDSPTASAVGGTVNYRTVTPRKEFGGQVSGSLGEYDFRRIFGVIHTGEIGPWGTRAFVSASTAKNDNPFNNYGKVDKQQYNAKIWQPLGANGDFISLAGHYNQNRNNFFGSLPLRQDLTRTLSNGTVVPRIVGPNAQNRYPRNGDERTFDINYQCRLDTPQAGVADAPASGVGPDGNPDPNGDFASCGTEFDRRYNPSNTGNIRGASRFTLAENLVLTVDPNFQYVKANGGGTVTGNEGLRDVNPLAQNPLLPISTTNPAASNCRTVPNGAGVQCVVGYLGGVPYFGRDVNGDGDTLDTVTVLAPSQTQTRRYGLIAGLRWDLNDDNVFRVSYTLDHARHRQTGEVGLLEADGEPEDVFPVNDPEEDVNGFVLQKRDRLSYAILNQVSGEYRGEFLDDRLTLNVGLRAPFFKRELDQRCFTSSASGFVECFGGNDALADQYAALNPNVSRPQERTFKYNKLLPNVGVQYDVAPRTTVFLNYAKGLSVPGTDNLYNSFFFASDADEARPDPETTDSFDAGLRYTSRLIQAQLSGWFTKFNNRLASAYDPELNATVYRNLGRVDKYGIDGSVAYEPFRALTLYAFGSWNKSKIKDNIQIGSFGGITSCDDVADPGSTAAIRSCAFTAGNREAGAPKYTYGFSGVGRIGELFELGATAKRTGPRYIFDNNQPVFAGDINGTNETQVFGATAPAYWLVNLDARFNLRMLRGLENS